MKQMHQTVAKAWLLLALAVSPFLPIVAGYVFQSWLNPHISIHNDAFVILGVVLVWLAYLVTVVIATPWMCWRMTRTEQRAWRVVIIVGSLLGCIAFLLTVIVNAGKAQSPA